MAPHLNAQPEVKLFPLTAGGLIDHGYNCLHIRWHNGKEQYISFICSNGLPLRMHCQFFPKADIGTDPRPFFLRWVQQYEAEYVYGRKAYGKEVIEKRFWKEVSTILFSHFPLFEFRSHFQIADSR